MTSLDEWRVFGGVGGVPRYDDASGNPYSGVLYGSFWCLTSWIPVDFGGFL